MLNRSSPVTRKSARGADSSLASKASINSNFAAMSSLVFQAQVNSRLRAAENSGGSYRDDPPFSDREDEEFDPIEAWLTHSRVPGPKVKAALVAEAGGSLEMAIIGVQAAVDMGYGETAEDRRALRALLAYLQA
jgi:hypothetical protein